MFKKFLFFFSNLDLELLLYPSNPQQWVHFSYIKETILTVQKIIIFIISKMNLIQKKIITLHKNLTKIKYLCIFEEYTFEIITIRTPPLLSISLCY